MVAVPTLLLITTSTENIYVYTYFTLLILSFLWLLRSLQNVLVEHGLIMYSTFSFSVCVCFSFVMSVLYYVNFHHLHISVLYHAHVHVDKKPLLFMFFDILLCSLYFNSVQIIMNTDGKMLR